MLLYVVLACWYGVALLCRPFYGPMIQSIRQEGWHVLYDSITGPLAPHLLLYQIWEGTLTIRTVVDMVFPLLMGAGGIMTVFFAFHVRYILLARTTLEHKILLQDTIAAILYDQGRPADTPIVNAFNQGWYRNLQQVLGPNFWWRMWVPSWNATPPPPFVPQIDKAQ